jgi:hypothetical protein
MKRLVCAVALIAFAGSSALAADFGAPPPPPVYGAPPPPPVYPIYPISAGAASTSATRMMFSLSETVVLEPPQLAKPQDALAKSTPA